MLVNAIHLCLRLDFLVNFGCRILESCKTSESDRGWAHGGFWALVLVGVLARVVQGAGKYLFGQRAVVRVVRMAQFLADTLFDLACWLEWVHFGCSLLHPLAKVLLANVDLSA